ncbi:haloacid dehalogenase [Companilactobacillus sp. RD055328]|uniref:Cof-type HAD-IIB family hydrolase n=1 Tax=Companilactobacillus sp. RD055328 TaxID=2916634 RepID=UPI001FC848A9|nr:Cof-type HAD-IIB family hydrolase [Companilactobacillus sp. RD055328]GKQ43013.1 haloacid dehalogenase [Companilactobacillus sp. RD055328]
MIKLIASDMDGTLLNDKMEVSEQNAKAIKAAQEAGIEFLVATGRSIKEAKPFFEQANIKSGLITLNGAEIFDTDANVVESFPITSNTASKVTTILDNNDIYYEITTNKGVFSNSYESRLNGFVDIMIQLNPDLTHDEAVKVSEEKLKVMSTQYIDSYDQLLDNSEYEILKIIAFSSNGREYLADLVTHLSEEEKLIITSSSSNNIEINDYNAQKGFALMDYAKKHGYQPDEVMAIGDNLNDFSMIEMAGTGVAMKNAISEIKEIADVETDTNINDGVAKIIKKAINDLTD